MIQLDGSMGEGGGQVLRTALALSAVTGQAFRIDKIRAGRSRPGLRRQHLTAVEAAAAVAGATVEGASLGAVSLTFRPRSVRPGRYRFDVGTAGSATLVLQTVLPPLLAASAPSRLALAGGTHNPHAPPFEFLAHAFLPRVESLGPRISARLVRPGFYPAGGGELEVEIEPSAALGRLELPGRGRLLRREATALIARLPRHIAERELAVVGRELEVPASALRVEEVREPRGPGNALIVTLASERVTEVFTGFGQRGVPAEKVARGVVRRVRRYLASGAAVGEHLADQLLLPLALGQGGVFTTLPLTLHATTNLEVIRRFVDIEARVEREPGERVRLKLVPRSSG